MFFEVKPLSNKYRNNIPKNNPNGSDLNHPMGPLIMIGSEIENNNDAISPAVVPPRILTRAKMTIAVKELKITGKSIVKSYSSEFEPKIQ